ncbi:hypothetical protein LCGC14_2731690 [marine sediment metagenome]|uniref:Uncharacterized protein n=1 Tax=marine sediment metagenome TaxID=412755 RepID=A0A0F9BG07_9ZZZZ
MPEVTQESKSSVKVTLNAKGEAQLEIKLYEGEVCLRDDKDAFEPIHGHEIPAVLVRRLFLTIRALEQRGIKVVGRDLPDEG